MSTIVGIDIGGTFTDFISMDGSTGSFKTTKVPSTPNDFSQGFMDGLRLLDLDLRNVQSIIHGTTVATNALIERKGARCGLLTTKGFRDIIELGRRERPAIYGLNGTFDPLIERQWRLEVNERVTSEGVILVPVDETEIATLTCQLLEQGVEALVICFLHSYKNPTNERRAEAVVRRLWPNDFVVVSSHLLPEFREFERTSTCAVSAYVQPTVSRYLQALEKRTRAAEYEGDILMMQSNGGVMSSQVARLFAVNTILSGPAAGAIAAMHIAGMTGHKKFISCDMGGTSLDVCLVRDGRSKIMDEREIGYRIPVRLSMLDIETLGAGGGSIARIDHTGILQVGPQSSGANPGPAAYGRGGTDPTVTDANLVLGLIDPKQAIAQSSDFTLHLNLAQASIVAHIAKPLGLSLYEAARAIVEVVNNKVSGAVRRVSIGRGEDPREYVLIMFGGAGPLHASSIMRTLGISRTLIPLYPGITSALGCALADVHHDFVQTVDYPLDSIDIGAIHNVYRHHIASGKALLEKEGIDVQETAVLVSADMIYEGQTHTLKTMFATPQPTLNEIYEAFYSTYEQRYGVHYADMPVRVVTLRTSVIGIRPSTDLKNMIPADVDSLRGAERPSRPVFFQNDFVECPVYRRLRLAPGTEFRGPAILEQPDCTSFVGPGDLACVDQWGNLIVTRMEDQ